MRRAASRPIDRNDSSDRGFSLVEILVVIVVLGILAAVTVFAVRGVSDRGEESVEATDLRALTVAVESYWAQHGEHAADEAALVAAGMLHDESTLHDYVRNADGTYTITNVRTGESAASGGGTLPMQGTPMAYAGVSGHRYGNPSLGDNDYDVIIGGAVGAAQFDQLVDTGSILVGSDWVVFVPVGSFSSPADVTAFVAADQAYRDANEGGGTPRILFMESDDVAAFDGANSLLDAFLDDVGVDVVGPSGSWSSLQDRFDS